MQEDSQLDSLIVRLNKENNIFAQAALRERLVFFIRDLLMNNFSGLLQILYKVDVDEDLLKTHLRDNADKDAAEIITDLLVSRELQKRNDQRPGLNLPDAGNIPEDEKW